MNKYSAIEQCTCISWILSILYLIEVPLLSNTLITRIIWIPGIIYILVISIISLKCIRLNEIISIIISLTVLILGVIIGNVYFSERHWIAILCYMTQIISMIAFSNSKISKKIFDFVYYCVICLTLIFTIYSLSSIAFKVTTNGTIWYTIYYVFNLDNSNLAGIYLFCVFVFLLINLKYRNSKLLIIFLMLDVFWMIYRTNARSCIFSAIAVTFIELFNRQRKIPIKYIVSCMISPVIFALIYVYLFKSEYYNNIQILGKNFFTGRQDIYLNYLSKLYGMYEYLLGNFAENALQNAHNAPISIFTSMGILGIISTYYIIFMSICKINYKKTILSATCVVCILGIIIQTSAESTMILGGFPGIVFFNTLFLLGNYDEKYNYSS